MDLRETPQLDNTDLLKEKIIRDKESKIKNDEFIQ